MSEDIEIGVFQDGQLMASGIGKDRHRLLIELLHYAAQYAKDGPVEVCDVKRGNDGQPIPAPPDPAP